MCGISGMIGKPDKEALDCMLVAIHHRGPDDRGKYNDENVAIGMTRLAIIDTSSAGHQPMSNANQTVWIVYNGEMYNFQEEKKILCSKGYNFQSHTDTEVVLKMYEVYGESFLQRMRGMFALAIYDKNKKQVLLARDQLGIKPLLIYTGNSNQLIFASEIKALIASKLFKPQIYPDALRQLLTYGAIRQPDTFLKGVSMLLPAHYLVWKEGKTEIKKYWNLSPKEDLSKITYQEQVERIREELTQSVKLQMVSDVPLGAFLSGGVDSGLMVAIMAKQLNQKLKTFSIGFEAEGSHIDETDDAQKLADFVGTEHHKIIVTGKEVREKIEKITLALDQPSVDGVNSYFVSQAARAEVTVAISGTGGDELFTGYPWFASMAQFQASQPKGLIDQIKLQIKRGLTNDFFNTWAVKNNTSECMENWRRSTGFLANFTRQYQIFGMLRTAQLVSEQITHQAFIGREPAIDFLNSDEISGGTPVQRVSALCLRGYTQNQLLRDIDATSMSHSLEVRVPFLDHLLTETALALPDESKLATPQNQNVYQATYNQLGAKRILLDVGKNLLPPDMGNQIKRGFGMPFDHWLRTTLKDVMEDTLSQESVLKRGIFNFNAIKLLKQDFDKQRASWAEIWLLMMIELWCRKVLD